MRRSKLRGHSIIKIDGEWLYEDTMEPTLDNERPCGHCGKPNTDKGHDGCLGYLPNIMNACCGHGENSDAYIQCWSGDIIKGDAAFDEINRIKISQERMIMARLIFFADKPNNERRKNGMD